jgi:endoglucanase
MKNKMKIRTILITIFTLALSLQAQDSHPWWHDQYGRRMPFEGDQLPLIRVEGNKFVDPEGNPVLFRGLSISDPDKVEIDGHWNRRLFEEAKEWGAGLIRIPVHPVSWRKRGPEGYFKLLDQAVEWCTELEMYIIIDWHSIGNLRMELFQNPMYETTAGETYQFWRLISRRYTGINTIAFYELFNEPTIYRGQLGRISWSEWKEMNIDMIHTIRGHDQETIPLVAGFDWAYDLSPLRTDPLPFRDIGYVSHPYGHKRSKPWEPKWEENFGFAAWSFPVLATEIGFVLGDTGMKDNADYGEAIIKFLEDRGIGWVAWVFDPEWHPNMIKSWDTFEYTESGDFFSKAAKGEPE